MEIRRFIIDYRKVDKNNPSRDGYIMIDSSFVFKDSKEKDEFLSSLSHEWKRIPPSLLKPATVQSFVCYARLAKLDIDS